jgi:tetratricopeptide (TPR) repeat protein
MAVVLAVMVLAYHPAWFGTPLWDDDHHLTPVALQSVDGLKRIWTEIDATTQFYPLLHSAFWLQHRLWGDAMLGYHLANLAIHGLASVLVWITLRRLTVPGAALAAALFALHPVQVESVAWVTELKNTLSTVFYALAALSFLRFADSRRPWPYVAAMLWFAAALLSKTVTGMLPFAMLTVLWWRNGRLRAREDLLPLVPFVVIGVAMGLLTAWWELSFNRTDSVQFQMSLVERTLVAGRAIVFQLTSLVWPAGLLFSYPRWTIDAGDPWQFVFPAAVLAALALGWSVRHTTRGPLAALLFFIINLGPTLGVFNLYTFRYTYVADHYQYLACASIFAAVAAGWWQWASVRPARQRIAIAVAGGVLLVLTGLTWRQSQSYRSAEASYSAILRGNPESWFAHSNLGALKLDAAPAEAVTHLREALRLNPELAEAHSNLGIALLSEGRVREALVSTARALELNPNLPAAQQRMGDVLRRLGRLDEALQHYEAALRLRPRDAQVHATVGQLLARMGRDEQALRHLQTAIDLDPASADARNALGFALADLGRFGNALVEHQRALRLSPGSAVAHYGLGNIHQAEGRLAEAVAAYEAAVKLDPLPAETHNNLGVAYDRLGRTPDAERAFRAALGRQPLFENATINLANLLVRHSKLSEAARLYMDLIARDPDAVEARVELAALLVRTGRRDDAVRQLQEVLKRQPNHLGARRELDRLLR